MTTSVMDSMRLSSFIKQNKSKIYEEARRNVNLNENGQPTISKDDAWFHENIWDEHYKKMCGNK